MPDNIFYNATGPYQIDELVDQFGGKVYNGHKKTINGAATLYSANEHEISFFSNQKYAEDLNNTKAAVCIIEENNRHLAPDTLTLWVVTNAYEVWAKILAKFYPTTNGKTGIHQSAIISPTATISPDSYIGAGSYIGNNAVINSNCYIAESCYIGEGVKIDINTHIHHNVTITHSNIGHDCIIHPGVRIGQDGFGFAPGETGITKVPQVGRVVIGSHVEIGANTCIDRGAIEDTVIGDHTKIDNLVQIGHNVIVGKYCIIVSQTGIAGSSSIGDGSILGGQSGVSGHVKVGSKVTLAARGGIIKDVKDGEVLGGFPAVPIRQWHKQTAILKKLATKNDKQS